MKKILFGALILALILALFYSLNKIERLRPQTGKIKIITTLFPLYDFAKNIGQDKTEVTLLLPPGVEPHSFEPTPSDIANINTADIFVFTGKFMEPWVAEIIKGSTNKNLLVVDDSNGVRLIDAVFHDSDEPAGASDPHIWLDFDNDRIMAKNILEALQTKDPSNETFYQNNFASFSSQLNNLDEKYQSYLSTCQNKTLVYGGHYALGYLAKRYGLNYLAAQGLAPDAEPTAQDLIKLIEQIKKNKIKYIFYEELTSPKISETLAQETRTKMLLLNAGHNLSKNDFLKGETFLSLMEKNLKNLKTGLDCSEIDPH
ncbi:MAG: Periplasmic solute binding protein [Candidatus Magasanikbacteria bacterium GW2011_GWC2_40_17]|uniref:Periplasmic solute binding protein n=1 Tax=Candidatus Magasanikbacteria bacterium GW2011_GWA2_42_32 TaxID=1619039 RepID=A0A0G1D5J9_9BACT|nr:MAG: Periplasmic solute binding protein [Candidatus Magasanikbacteria bacterium GW2011_GWC2_40_17]KKS57318.1 MAG: Periplasmic solute binding protein [Candidatus Magasanikbacteria bacterium GW2011_GWA2_42_32]OGH85802.1 MAG: hypothetical protein A2294_02435 [Candidatus Magasanikbacteria bacterium RIFOXYB2_FULL_38_10]